MAGAYEILQLGRHLWHLFRSPSSVQPPLKISSRIEPIGDELEAAQCVLASRRA
jgi:hypothetical protein